MNHPKNPSVADVIDSLGHEMIDGKSDDMTLADAISTLKDYHEWRKNGGRHCVQTADVSQAINLCIEASEAWESALFLEARHGLQIGALMVSGSKVSRGEEG